MSPLPFFSRGFDPFLEGLSSSVSWLNDHWLWLFSLALVGLAVTLIRSWSWLLDWEAGRWWPVPASLLPAMIPITRDLQEDAPSWVKTGTVVVLLTAVAVLQVYGQERNNRDRLNQDLARARAESEISEQRNLLIAAINEAREGRDEARERARRTDALLCRIADGITAAAAAAEEAQEENE
jgi:hypothetical protein